MQENSINYRHFLRAGKVIPSGWQAGQRTKSGDVPLYLSHGEGARVFDLDGQEYIDYSLGWGPGILGHSNAALRAALHRQVDRLYSRATTTLEAEAAELINQLVPCAEMVRFANGGGDAMTMAHRIARAHTGRNMIVRFNGHYHGSFDALYGGIADDPHLPVPRERREDEGDVITQLLCRTNGRGRHAFADTYAVEWNELGALRALFERHGADIAAVCMEPINLDSYGCHPDPGYLQGVRELCTRHGVLLIFDEVLTGFRMGLGGAQAHFAVTPDLTIFGKAVGGGLPVSVYCGRREIMEVLDRQKIDTVGTYYGHPLSMTAVITTLTELAKDDGAAFRHLRAMGERLAEGLREIFRRRNLPFILQGFPGAWILNWTREGEIRNHADGMRRGEVALNGMILEGMLTARRVLGGSRFFVSVAHTARDIDETLQRADAACAAFSADGPAG